tara:strand:+ start:499 stop:1047 length:549 start_codon:yes stop_codon:yes gene_type:complete
MDRQDELESLTVYPCDKCGYLLSGKEADVRAHLAMPTSDEIPASLFYIDRHMSERDKPEYGLVVDRQSVESNGYVWRGEDRLRMVRSSNLEDPLLHSGQVRVIKLIDQGHSLEPYSIMDLGSWRNGLDLKEMLLGDHVRGDLLGDEEFARIINDFEARGLAYSDFPLDQFVNSLDVEQTAGV